MRLHAQIACSLPDKAEIIEAGDLAELVYYRCILRCREYLTDGVIDRRLVSRWFAGIRGKPAAHLDRLVGVDMLHEHPDGWCIPPEVWGGWNPTRVEVEAKRDAETERKRQWKDRRRDETATTSRQNGDTRRDRQPEPEPEPEPDLLKNSHSSGGSNTPLPPAAAAAIELMLDIRASQDTAKIEDRGRWRAGTAPRLIAQHSERLLARLGVDPNANAATLAVACGFDRQDVDFFAGMERT